MAKRKYSDDHQFLEDDGSDYGDNVSKPTKSKRIRSAPKQRVGRVVEDVATSDLDFDGNAGETHQHALSIHTIISLDSICAALLDWYAGVHESRGMPWRKPYDPSLAQGGRSQRAYEVWVSEIMLQQTQVATVIPYYNKWMKRFPTVCELASSDIETVNYLWKGLGYYSRAARLLRGAQYVVDDLNGQMPTNAEDMQAKIPGIGRYSAGAICSIAYNQRVPVLDGNVHRLLSRFLALYAPPKSKTTLDVLWSGATDLVNSTDRPGDLNQALIELGSVVCKVREPSCTICPIQSWCRAYQGTRLQAGDSRASRGDEIPDIEDLCNLCDPLPKAVPVTLYPMKAKRKAVREELDLVNVVEWRGDHDKERWFLLVRRPKKGLLAGLHEFPTMANVSHSQDLRDILVTLLSELLSTPLESDSAKEKKASGSSDLPDDVDSLRIAKIQPAGDVMHVFSHLKKTYRVQWVLLEGGGLHPPKLRTEFTSSTKTSHRTKSGAKPSTKMEDSRVIDANHEARDGQSAPIPPALRWVAMQGVTDANIGNGVLKIWNRVMAHWDSEMKSSKGTQRS